MQPPIIVHICKDAANIEKHVSDQRNLCISKRQFMALFVTFYATIKPNPLLCFMLFYDIYAKIRTHLQCFGLRFTPPEAKSTQDRTHAIFTP